MSNEMFVKMEKIQEEISALRKLMETQILYGSSPLRDTYTAQEVAVLCGKKVETVKDHEKRGKLRVSYPNAKKRYHRKDVERYLKGVW